MLCIMLDLLHNFYKNNDILFNLKTKINKINIMLEYKYYTFTNRICILEVKSVT